MKIQSAVLAMAVAFGMIAGACASSSGGGSGSGGSSNSAGGGSSAGALGTGGGSSGGAAAACSNTTACGGSALGTWNATSSCLKVTGQLDLSLVGAGCATAPVTGSLTVSGTWTANADGTYTDNTMTTGDEQFTLAPSCLVISSTQTDCPGAANIISALGYATVTCTPATGGGCACSATVHQSGGMGTVSNIASPSGNYATATNVITIDNQAPYAYCASPSTMTWTPQTTTPATAGTIAFEKSTSTGAGGAGGAGGMGAGAAGAGTGTAGASGSGGGGTGGAGSTSAPCDIYKSGGTPCVAAHSTVRALLGAYSGKLYQVRNAAGTTKDISSVTAGGVADAAAQDTFCSGTTC